MKVIISLFKSFRGIRAIPIDDPKAFRGIRASPIDDPKAFRGIRADPIDAPKAFRGTNTCAIFCIEKNDFSMQKS